MQYKSQINKANWWKISFHFDSFVIRITQLVGFFYKQGFLFLSYKINGGRFQKIF